MGSAIWNIVDWISIDEATARLLRTHGADPAAAVRFELGEPSAYALTRLGMQGAVDSDEISGFLLLYVDLDGDLREVMLSSEDLRLAGGTLDWERARLPRLTIALPESCVSEKLAEYLADRNVAKRIGRSPPVLHVYLWRHEVERRGWWLPSEPLPAAIVKPGPEAAATSLESGKDWVRGAYTRHEEAGDIPKGHGAITAFADTLHDEMIKDPKVKVLTPRYIEEILRHYPAFGKNGKDSNRRKNAGPRKRVPRRAR